MESRPDVMHAREPCPDRILDDTGGAFAMGAIGGSLFHFFKGVRNSPKGDRFIGGSQAVRMNAPRIGGSFAVWGGIFSVVDCTMVYVRQKEDPWNSIVAGAAAGGFLQMRQGLVASSRSALVGGVLLALIEGTGMMLNRLLSASQDFLPPMEEAAALPGMPPSGSISIPVVVAADEESSSSWFGGLFDGGKKEDKTNDGSKTKILESFDSPTMPVPSFDYK